jgi:hypothetical protein
MSNEAARSWRTRRSLTRAAIRGFMAMSLAIGPACGGGSAAEFDAGALDGVMADAADDMVDAGLATISVFTYASSFSDPSTAANADFVAIRDGDSQWRALVGDDGLYTAQVHGPRYSVAVGCRRSLDVSLDHRQVQISNTTVDEQRVHQFYACNRDVAGPVQLELVFRGADWLAVTASTLLSIVSFDVGAAQTIDVPAHVGDLVLSELRAPGDARPPRVMRLRDLDMRSSRQVEIDLARDGLASATGTFAEPAIEPDARVAMSVAIVRDRGQRYVSTPPLWFDGFRVSTTPRLTYQAVPAAMLRPGEFSRVTYSVATDRGVRSSASYVLDALSISPSLPPYFEPPAPTLLQEPYVRAGFAFPVTTTSSPAEYSMTLVSDGIFGPQRRSRTWTVSISEGWLGNVPVGGYELPDFTGVPGWDPGMALIERDSIRWTMRRTAGAVALGGETGTSTRSGIVGEYCGDAVVQEGEDCDAARQQTATCDLDCTFAECGDGVVNAEAGETCDPPTGGVCSASCTVVAGR